jgi:hypothetical protein
MPAFFRGIREFLRVMYSKNDFLAIDLPHGNTGSSLLNWLLR